MKKCIGALVALLALVTGAKSVSLFDLTFEQPEYQVGLPPAIGPESHQISAITFGNPTVVDNEPLLDGKSLALETSGPYQQIRLVLDTGATVVTLDFDFVSRGLQSGGSFVVSVDAPYVRNLTFAGGQISAYDSERAYFPFGRYEDGQRHHVEMTIDLSENLWRIRMDGADIFTTPINAGSVESIRFHLDSVVEGPLRQVFLDNIAISDSGPDSIMGSPFIRHGERMANTTRKQNQEFPSLGMNARGQSVVVWTTVEPGSYAREGIFGQRFDENGNAVGGEFQVTPNRKETVERPQVLVQPDGRFIVVWSSPATYENDIFARKFDAEGQPEDDKFPVTFNEVGDQRAPSIAGDGRGNFVIAWESKEDGQTAIYARRCSVYGWGGAKISVSQSSTESLGAPSVTMNATGEFAVSWSSFDGSAYNILACRFDNTGEAIGTSWIANSSAGTRFRGSSKIGIDTTGRCVLVWTSEQTGTKRIYGRQFDSSATPMSGEFLIDRQTVDRAEHPSLAMHASGAFVVAWSSYLQDGHSWGVQALRYDSTGAADGTEFHANGAKEFAQTTSLGTAVAVDAAGNFAVTWQGAQSTGRTDIYTDRFTLITKPTVVSESTVEVGTGAAVVRGVVNPQGEYSRVRFEYGPDQNYGHSTDWEIIGSGTTSVSTIAYITGGMKPNSTYHFRVVAKNDYGITIGPDHPFITGNSDPIARDDFVHPASRTAPTVIDVRANDTDYDGDTLTVSVPNISEPGYNAAVSTDGNVVRYTPSSYSNGNDSFIYRIHDPFGGVDEARVYLANRAPTAQDHTTSIQTPWPWESTSIDLTPLVSDPDGDSLFVTSVTQGSYGAVAFQGLHLTYSPKNTYFGNDTFTYTVSDGVGFSAAGTITVKDVNPLWRVQVTKNGLVPDSPQLKWGSFGTPSIFAGGRQIGFLATVSDSGRNLTGIFGGALDHPKLLLRTGESIKNPTSGSPTGLRFEHFQEPVFATDGPYGPSNFAVIARINGRGVTKSNDTGIWAKISSWMLQVAREGDFAPGTVGARFEAFESLVLPTNGTLFFSARLSHSSGGVTASNDEGLWLWHPNLGTIQLIREGMVLGNVLGPRRVRSFRVFSTGADTNGHPRYTTDSPGVDAVINFDDASVVARITAGGIHVFDSTGVTIEKEKLVSFDMPSGRPESGYAPVVLAVLKSFDKKISSYRVIRDCDSGTIIASENGPVPDLDGVFFRRLYNPVVGRSPDLSTLVAFKATLRGKDPAKNEGIWITDAYFFNKPLMCLARKGDEPPGIPGAQFEAFERLTVLDKVGPMFTARLKAAPDVVDEHNDRGCWIGNQNGVLRLLVREGDIIGGKVLRSFTMLGTVRGSSGQQRIWTIDNTSRTLGFRAVFTDGTQGILTVALPLD